MQSVQSDVAPGQIQFPEELARHWDFIGFVIDQRTARIELSGHSDRAQEGVARAMVGLLAIDCDQGVRGGDWPRAGAWMASMAWLRRSASNCASKREKVDWLGAGKKPWGLGRMPKARR